MAKPRAAQLEQASGLSPLARDWIKALVAEAVDDLARRMPPPAPAQPIGPPAPDLVLKGRVDDLAERFMQLEKRYDDSETYALTKAKVIALLKREGIK